jgi:TatD DNase family protein
MLLFDTHAHLACSMLWPGHEAILERAVLAGVKKLTTICTHQEELERGRFLYLKDPGFHVLAAATGPNETEHEGTVFFPHVEQAAFSGLLQAIGETGLDLHWNTSSIEAQTHELIRYLRLALESRLPVVLHCRKAFEPLLEILDKHYVGKEGFCGGIFHCFSEGLSEANEVIARGFQVSFSGIITYKSALAIQEAATFCDIDHMLIETDSPYLRPGKERQKINEPDQVVHVAEKIAQLRSLPVDFVAQKTYENGCRLFQLKANN